MDSLGVWGWGSLDMLSSRIVRTYISPCLWEWVGRMVGVGAGRRRCRWDEAGGAGVRRGSRL